MEIIKLDKDELFSLKTKSNLKGYESSIFIYGDSLIKVFNQKEVVENKVRKLKLISQTNIKDIKPTALVETQDGIIGYMMPYLKDYYNIDSLYIGKKKKKEIFIKLLDKIEKLHKEGIIYGDFNSKNLLFSSNVLDSSDFDLVLCDIDNVSIGGLDFDLKSKVEERYINKFGIDETLDTYMYNLFTVCFMYNWEMPLVLDHLRYYPHHFIRLGKNYKYILDNYINLTNKDFKQLIKLP